MKSTRLLRLMSVTILTIGVAVTPLGMPASAQVAQAQETYPQRIYDDFDWGWLGLLGLIGLAGLFGRKGRPEDTDTRTYRDPNREEATAYRDPFR